MIKGRQDEVPVEKLKKFFLNYTFRNIIYNPMPSSKNFSIFECLKNVTINKL